MKIVRTLAATIIAISLLAPAPVIASPEAEAIIHTLQMKERERWGNVASYITVESSTGTGDVVLFYERYELGFRLVPSPELNKRLVDKKLGLPENVQEEIAEKMAFVLFTGAAGASGLLPGEWGAQNLVSGAASRVQGEIHDFRKTEDAVNALQSMQDFQEFARGADVTGTETFNGRPAFLLVRENFSETQRSGRDEFTITDAAMFIDTEEYVVLGMRVEGEGEANGNSGPFEVEHVFSDYRSVGSLYLPFHKRADMNFEMMLGDDDREELEQMQGQLDEYQQHLDSLPPAQRAQFESMMGGQLDRLMERLRSMAAGSGLRSETIVKEIEIGDINDYFEKGERVGRAYVGSAAEAATE